MLIHILCISSVLNGEPCTEEPVPFLSLKKAKKAMRKAFIEAVSENWVRSHWNIVKTRQSIIAHETGNYNYNNYCVEIHSKKIKI